MRRDASLFGNSAVLGPGHYRRLAALAVLLGLGFVAVLYRLVDVQVWQHEELRLIAIGGRIRTVPEAPLRGRILDRAFGVLAGSTYVKTVVGNPRLAGTNAAWIARTVAPLLGLEEAKLAKQLEPGWVTNSQGRVVQRQYVVLKKMVPLEVCRQVDRALRALPVGEDEPGLTRREKRRRQDVRLRLLQSVKAEAMNAQVRYYPGATLAAHLLGLTGVGKETPQSPWQQTPVGVEGLEYKLDAVLRGTYGWRETERVRMGRRLIYEPGGAIGSRPGCNVVLTLDATVQRIVEKELEVAFRHHRPVSVSCVVVRPSTGEILALANQPTFDPNRPGDAPVDHRRNRVITDLYEPGSTFKVVTIAGALDAGVVSLGRQFHCENGRFFFHGVPLRDDHRFQALDVQHIIAKSSNIGAAKIGIEMGPALLFDTIRRFGFGEATGIPLLGERAGTVLPTNRWSKISVAWIPMGHEVAVTPLQMTMAVAAVANGGRLMRPMLLREILNDEGQPIERYAPSVRRQVIQAATARQVVTAMQTAVQSGTGVRAQLEHYPVAGKTGTAQKIVDGRYVHDRHFTSFVGFFPAPAPELCIGVFMDDPKVGSYGADTAAPLFAAIAQQTAVYLGLPPVALPEEGDAQGRQAQLERGLVSPVAAVNLRTLR